MARRFDSDPRLFTTCNDDGLTMRVLPAEESEVCDEANGCVCCDATFKWTPMNSKQSQVALPHFKLIPIPNDKTKWRLSCLYLPVKEKKNPDLEV